MKQGHPSVAQIGVGTVSQILSRQEIRPHKVTYYLQRRDPDFDAKMAQVLCVYQQVQWALEDDTFRPVYDVMVSYDEKPGIQAIYTTAPDLPPVPGKHASTDRDPEYVRHGTLSVLAGIDLLTGEVIGTVEERHRSKDLLIFLRSWMVIMTLGFAFKLSWITTLPTPPKKLEHTWKPCLIALNLCSLPSTPLGST
ncbi:hypothetical protein [Effusibacillus dendaii]|uniref:Transposase n=1 Tax=Effusibacillus dendaii TaxID=2743772 RepID=A0A7I8DGZ7_9BACL|nr:hypothetical protein [Effusibacillus dendaii]BCJ88156.1 hypothetical protein skT53_31410 [Effusibacillus dendaii]